MDSKKDKPMKENALARMGDDLAVNQREGFVLDFGYNRLQQTMQICTSIAQSGMVPRDYQNAPKKVLVASAMGARFGLDPLQSLQSIAVVNGTPTFYGDALLGMVKSSDKEEWTLEGVKAMEHAAEASDIYKKWLDHYDYKPSKIAFCITKRKDEDEPTIQYYTIDQAKDAGLLSKDNWKKFAMRMLQMRARSYALRDAYPDVLKGYKTAEEMYDVDDDKAYAQEPLPESTGDFLDTQDWNEVNDEEEQAEEADFELQDEEEGDDYHDVVQEEPETKEKKKGNITSDDMLAKDAIEQIEKFESVEPLKEFVELDIEDRSTVVAAYEDRLTELQEPEEPMPEQQAEESDKEEDEDRSDDDLFADSDEDASAQGSFEDFENEENQANPI